MRMRAVHIVAVGCLSTWLAVACNAESNQRDAGARHDGAVATDAGSSCTPFGAPQCPAGQTCCLSDFIGTCRPQQQCPGTVHFQCEGSRDCGKGKSCCGTFTDESDGGAVATTVCEPACAGQAHEVCNHSSDCANHGTCTVLPEGTSSPILAAAVEVFGVCFASDAGAAP